MGDRHGIDAEHGAGMLSSIAWVGCSMESLLDANRAGLRVSPKVNKLDRCS